MPLPKDLSNEAELIFLLFVEQTKKNTSATYVLLSNLQILFQKKTNYPAAVCNAMFANKLLELTRSSILKVDKISAGNDAYLFTASLHEMFADHSLEYYNLDRVAPPVFSLTPQQEKIPAADRFVSVSDNQIDISQALSALDELACSIRSANDLTLNAEYRLQISKEINFLKEIIEQPKIHVVALWDGIKNNHTLEWLAEKVGSELVREVAAKALVVLTNLLTNLINHL